MANINEGIFLLKQDILVGVGFLDDGQVADINEGIFLFLLKEDI